MQRKKKIQAARSVNELLERILKIVKELDDTQLAVRVKADQIKLQQDKIKDIEKKHRERVTKMKKTLKRKQQALSNAQDRARIQAAKPEPIQRKP